MEHSEGQESEISEIPETIEVVPERKVPHVLCIQVGSSQHLFEFDTREEPLKYARQALSQGWVEIEDEKNYLLVMAGPSSGIVFVIMSKAEVFQQRLQAQQAQAAQAAAQKPQHARQSLVIPGR